MCRGCCNINRNGKCSCMCPLNLCIGLAKYAPNCSLRSRRRQFAKFANCRLDRLEDWSVRKILRTHILVLQSASGTNVGSLKVSLSVLTQLVVDEIVMCLLATMVDWGFPYRRAKPRRRSTAQQLSGYNCNDIFKSLFLANCPSFNLSVAFFSIGLFFSSGFCLSLPSGFYALRLFHWTELNFQTRCLVRCLSVHVWLIPT